VFILDTREQDEFDVSHLKYARHVGYIWFDMRSVYDIPKQSTIVVYCAVGNRAERIGEKLLKAGYKNVYNLYGGIFEWINQGNPVYTSDMVQTSEIHGYNKHWGNWLIRGAKVF
jgi:rhodanese-related sulfurtransferase